MYRTCVAGTVAGQVSQKVFFFSRGPLIFIMNINIPDHKTHKQMTFAKSHAFPAIQGTEISPGEHAPEPLTNVLCSFLAPPHPLRGMHCGLCVAYDCGKDEFFFSP